jgi:3-oxoacyl-[acyl-carrier protein] reductase
MKTKHIVITGAGAGIGAAIARRLAPNNRLILHYYSSSVEVMETMRAVEQTCASVDIVKADLSLDEGCGVLYEQIRERFQTMDVLVNNAGGMIERCSVANLSWDHVLRTFSLNTFSTMRLTGLCTELLLAGENSCVVNITSIAIRHGAPSATAYGAAKAAIDAFTRGAASELAPRVRVNAIAPGIVDTRFHERVTPAAKMKQFLEATPLKRFGDVDDVARTAEFLIESKFISGETIDCNGGLFMR